MDDLPSKTGGLTYEQAGVSIEAQGAAIELIKPLAADTYTPRVVSGVGGFGALFDAGFEDITEPVLVASTDGVGTKVKLAARFNRWEGVGRDLVAVCVNDVITTGAHPLFFLDYIACHKLEPQVVQEVVRGMRDACLECGCALIGGEMAEMGEVYRPGEMDLAGFAVGVVDRLNRIDGGSVVAGDVVVGLPSNGVHSNGFSLVRKVFEGLSDAEWQEHSDRLGCSLVEDLLRPTQLYHGSLRTLLDNGAEVKAVAHISGGGLPDNAGRVLPPGLDVVIERAAVPAQPIFGLIAEHGGVAEKEMWHTFNMGVGMMLIIAPEQVDEAVGLLAEGPVRPVVIGRILSGDGRVHIQ
jgi:phosphoribosylformylglycinamidine cyclo-ligase